MKSWLSLSMFFVCLADHSHCLESFRMASVLPWILAFTEFFQASFNDHFFHVPTLGGFPFLKS